MLNKFPKQENVASKSTCSQPRTESIQRTPGVSVLPDIFCAMLSVARVDYLASSLIRHWHPNGTNRSSKNTGQQSDCKQLSCNLNARGREICSLIVTHGVCPAFLATSSSYFHKTSILFFFSSISSLTHPTPLNTEILSFIQPSDDLRWYHHNI